MSDATDLDKTAATPQTGAAGPSHRHLAAALAGAVGAVDLG
jgi:hypothetical protein